LSNLLKISGADIFPFRICGDLSMKEGVDSIIKAVVKKHTSLDAIIHCAAYTVDTGTPSPSSVVKVSKHLRQQPSPPPGITGPTPSN
jgi:hypothetical protein